ncbi:hypothetical protein CG740_35120 [Streptomyces sp. CB01201]|nr:hypothetical protein CG740_35120 [Streptomyces sp. CB01201]
MQLLRGHDSDGRLRHGNRFLLLFSSMSAFTLGVRSSRVRVHATRGGRRGRSGRQGRPGSFPVRSGGRRLLCRIRRGELEQFRLVQDRY